MTALHASVEVGVGLAKVAATHRAPTSPAHSRAGEGGCAGFSPRRFSEYTSRRKVAKPASNDGHRATAYLTPFCAVSVIGHWRHLGRNHSPPGSLSARRVWAPIRPPKKALVGPLTCESGTMESPEFTTMRAYGPNGAPKRKRSIMESSPGSIADQDQDHDHDDNDDASPETKAGRRLPGVKRACNECRQQKAC